MTAPVNANINVLINTSQATAQLRSLQAQIATFNKSLSASSGAAAAQQAALSKALMDGANASRLWSARVVPMTADVQRFTTALDKGQLSLGQMSRMVGSQLPGMSRVFKREFDLMSRVAETNVKRMQTQYVALGNSATGAAQAMALTPTMLDQHASRAAVAAQRQMMMNRMIDLGTTKLLNWGKNTQWAGRQLMVGFSLPLAMLGTIAAKTFKEIDQASISFKRVYGNLSTTTAEMERNLQAVKNLGEEYTKYGIKLADTIELSSRVAATGATNDDLMAATEQTLRLSTLGLMEYGEALDATIALQTAFGISNEDLTSTIDFLNVVENETILTMQDMAAAIPRVAPVVRGLGGDVQDLAVFMTAMREGGVTAEQGANALKSGLGRMINPTKAAREQMEKFGLSIDTIIQKNKGDLMGMVQDFGKALATLGDFEQQQVLEKVFGKYQYARLGALFKNIANDASQANKTIDLAAMSVEDLAQISERELSKIEEATSTKFAAAIEKLKISIAPLGEAFMKGLMPIIDVVTKIADKFNQLPDGIKNAIAIATGLIAGVGPVILMVVGLVANGIANIGKLVQTIRKFFARLRGDSKLFNYLTAQEQEAAAAANALGGATEGVTGKFLGQARALERLISLLGTYSGALSSAAAAAPLAFGSPVVAGASSPMSAAPKTGGRAFFTPMGTMIGALTRRPTAAPSPQGYQGSQFFPGFADGITGVPGTGNKDTVPALLTPGESVVTKDATAKYAPIISAMNAGTIQGFAEAGGVEKKLPKAKEPVWLADPNKTVMAHGGAPTPIYEAKNNPALFNWGKDLKTVRDTGETPTSAKGFTNWVYANPNLGNKDQMTGPQLARVFRGPNRWNVMAPIVNELANKMGKTPQDVMRDPKSRKAVSAIASSMAAQLEKIPGKVTTEAFAQADKNAYAYARKQVGLLGTKEDKSPEAKRALKNLSAVRNTVTAVQFYGENGRIASRTAVGLDTQQAAFPNKIPATVYKTAKEGYINPVTGMPIPKRMGTGVRFDTAVRMMGADPEKAKEARAANIAAEKNGRTVATSMVRGSQKALRQNSPSREYIQIMEGVKQGIHIGTQRILSSITGDGSLIGNTLSRSTREALAKEMAKGRSGLVQMPPDPASIASQVRSKISGMEFAGPITSSYREMSSSLKNAFSAISMGISSAVQPFTTPMKTMAHRAASTIIDGFNNASMRIKSAYEAAALRTMLALDSVKNLPDSINKAATLAKGRLINMFQTMVPDNLGRRVMNKLFYGAQDIVGKGRQVGGLLGNRVPRAIAMDAIRQKSMEKFNSVITGASERIQAFSSKVTKAGQIIMNPVPRAIALDVIRQRGVEKLNSAIAPAADAMRRLASGASTAAQVLMNQVPRAIAMEVVKQRIVQAGRFAADTIRINIKGAMQIGKAAIQEGFNSARSFIINSAQNVRNALNTAGATIKSSASQLVTGFRLAIPEIKQAATSMATLIKESGKSLGAAIMDAASRARAAAAGFFTGGVDAQGRNRGQRMASVGNSSVMGLMGLSMAASFAGGEVGEMAQKIMPLTMGLMGLQMILPMLTNPMGAVVIATAAVAAGFIYLRKQLDDAAKEAANVGASMNGVANSIKLIEDATGFRAPTLEDRLFRFTDEDRKAMSEFGQYFESEAGSKFIEELKSVDSKERYQKVAYLISQAVASGLEKEKAEAFGYSIAEATGDALLKSNIARDFANKMFSSGSQKLLEMEKERISKFPSLPKVSGYSEYSQQKRTSLERKADIPWWQQALDLRLPGSENRWMATPSIGDYQLPSPMLPILPQLVKDFGELTNWFDFPDIPMITTTWTEAATKSKEVTEEAARGLGYYLQTVQNLANAEAVLEEERRNGVITFDEYQSRLKELNSLQEKTTNYVGDIFSVGADYGSMMQALENQLSFAGFGEDQIKRISENFSPDALAEQFFGEGKNFEGLTDSQKKYVQDVFTQTMSGLTPENISQRFADIESTYTDIAKEVVDAIENGVYNGLEDRFNKENLTEWIKNTYAGDFEMSYVDESKSPSAIRAQNLIDAQKSIEADSSKGIRRSAGLTELGTDLEEVQIALNSFIDQDAAAAIMDSRDSILELGDAIVKLRDYEDINIESILALDPKELNVDDVVRIIKEIKNIKFDKKSQDAFGNIAIDADKMVQSLIDAGIATKDLKTLPQDIANNMPTAVAAFNKIEKMAGDTKESISKVFTDAGNIKITPSIIPTLFGNEYTDSSEGISAALSNAFPNELPTTMLPIMISLLNPKLLQALSGLNPSLMNFMRNNPDAEAYTTGGYSGMPSTTVTIDAPMRAALNMIDAISEMDLGAGKGGPQPDPTPNGGSTGGGSKEKSALETLQDSIKERIALYLGITKLGKKLAKSKKGYAEDILAQITTNNSVAQQLRKLNISESLIADILNTGAENAQKIIDKLGGKGLRKLSREDILGKAGEFINENRSVSARGGYKSIAKRRLEESGKFTAEEIESILEDENATEIIALLPKKATRLWKQLIKSLRDAEDATKDVKTATEQVADDLDLYKTQFDAYTEAISQAFDSAEIAAADAVAAKFFKDNTSLAEALEKSTGHTVENGYQLADALERQIQKNERLIDIEQDKIDKRQEEINDLQHSNDLIQQRIDDLKREDEMRNRQSEALSHSLELMASAEDKIRETYQKRIDALDKVAQLNDHLINQQKSQLDLSKALSEGDIYAAAAAQQQMQASSVQYATDLQRQGLQQGMENQINALTNEQGLTRIQIEDQINNLKEQNYQNSLKIREEEDRIYNNNLEVKRLSNEIYDINEKFIEPLQNQNKEYERMISYYREDEDYAIKRVTIANMTREQFENQADELKRSIDNAENLDPWLEGLAGRYTDIYNAAKSAADEAARLAKIQGEEAKASKEKNASGTNSLAVPSVGVSNDSNGKGWITLPGFGITVPAYAKGGAVGTDTVPAMLSPGEYIMSRSAVRQYGTGFMSAINSGRFSMPRYSTGITGGKVSGRSAASINAPVYNSYSISVPVTQPNASADEIAYKVMTKIKSIEGASIRRVNGY